MLVRNDERRLARCLESAAGLASEIIVVDTGSTDRSREIAAEFGAKICAFDFTRIDFSAARNFGLEQATQRWILVLDADETLDRTAAPLIQDFIGRNENAGYYFERLNDRGDGQVPTIDYAIRLFPNRPEYRYRGRVHETVDAAILGAGGRLVRSAIRIHHDFASDPEARRARNLHYIEILKEEIAADPSDDSRLDFLAAEYHQLGMFHQAAEVAERIVRARPLDSRAHLHAGVYHLAYTNEPERARADFQQALRLRPGDPEVLSFLESLNQQPRIIGSEVIDRDAALEILHEFTKSESLRRHALQVETCVAAYARQFGEDETKWRVAALLHDFDYEIHPNAPDHPMIGEPMLAARGVPDDIRRAILSHANYSGVPRESRLEKTLFACDELSGFISACALVKPSRKVAEVDVKSVRKKLKDKAFARSVSRDDIVNGAAELGVDLDRHIEFCIEAMKADAEAIGL